MFLSGLLSRLCSVDPPAVSALETLGARRNRSENLVPHDPLFVTRPLRRTRVLVTPTSGESKPTVRLTAREREVLARIAAGMTSREIAIALGVGLRTVNTHREHIAKKTSASSVAAQVRYALDHGITEID